MTDRNASASQRKSHRISRDAATHQNGTVYNAPDRDTAKTCHSETLAPTTCTRESIHRLEDTIALTGDVKKAGEVRDVITYADESGSKEKT